VIPDPDPPSEIRTTGYPADGDYLRQVRRDERLADKVVDLLKEAILSGRLAAGDRLPPERTLGDRFGVSRTVVREAIRSLAAKGMVEVRSGSGTVVARVGAGSVAETMLLYLRGASIDDALIDEFRTMVEVHMAGVAAERVTEEDVEGMREVLLSEAECAQDHRPCVGPDAEFHRCVARAAHNPLYQIVLDAIGEPLMGALPARPWSTLEAHQRILDRIADHDADGAREAMRDHLADARRVWEEVAAMPDEPALEPAE
jgi:GntR family transcriptional regulator, transcriptional repressor for pyruvate dehydrogenase complex